MRAECVHAIVEMKSHLDGRELLDACEKIRAVKALPKTAFARTRSLLEMSEMYGRNYWYTPTAGLIFAFDSIDPEELGRQLAAWCRDKDVVHVPDGVYILNKAHLLWSTPAGEWRARPEPESDLAHLALQDYSAIESYGDGILMLSAAFLPMDQVHNRRPCPCSKPPGPCWHSERAGRVPFKIAYLAAGPCGHHRSPHPRSA
jgi:hypothetical protein